MSYEVVDNSGGMVTIRLSGKLTCAEFAEGQRKLGEIIETAPAHLKGDIQRWKSARRISKANTLKRDMLVYHLWRSGRFSNSEIGNQIGLSISSISRRAGKFQALLDRDKKVQTTYDKFKSIIKV